MTRNLLIELIHRQIFKWIGNALGGILGLETNKIDSKEVKLLINLRPNSNKIEPIRIITNKSIYVLSFKLY